METEGSYLSAPQTLTAEQIAPYEAWLLSIERSWRESFQPDALDHIAMATALEKLAGKLRSEAARMYAKNQKTP